jgi:hypothetical protein
MSVSATSSSRPSVHAQGAIVDGEPLLRDATPASVHQTAALQRKVYTLQMLSNAAFMLGAICYLVAAGGWLYLEDNGYNPSPAPLYVETTMAPINVSSSGSFSSMVLDTISAWVDSGLDAGRSLMSSLGLDDPFVLYSTFRWLELAGSIFYLINPVFDYLAEAALAPLCPTDHLPNVPRSLSCIPWQLLGISLFFCASIPYVALAWLALDGVGCV